MTIPNERHGGENNNMGAPEWLRKHLDADGSDLMPEMVRSLAERLMAADVEAICNAAMER